MVFALPLLFLASPSSNRFTSTSFINLRKQKVKAANLCAHYISSPASIRRFSSACLLACSSRHHNNHSPNSAVAGRTFCNACWCLYILVFIFFWDFFLLLFSFQLQRLSSTPRFLWQWMKKVYNKSHPYKLRSLTGLPAQTKHEQFEQGFVEQRKAKQRKARMVGDNGNQAKAKTLNAIRVNRISAISLIFLVGPSVAILFEVFQTRK